MAHESETDLLILHALRLKGFAEPADVSDATNLAEQLPNARLVRARSPFELRLRPQRLTRIMADCFADMWRRP